jgi:hypothetical protein
VNFKLDNRYFDKVICELEPFFQENNITEKDGLYSNENKVISVKYDEARQMYALSVADVVEGNKGDFREINAWLFDDTQTARDATAVGIDFAASLRKEFGIKRKRTTTGMIDLPTVTNGSNVDIPSFTKKILDVFPALKDEYKNHISVYGNFLYLNFFGEQLVPRIIRLFEEGTPKQVKKFYDVLGNAYSKGDKDTVNTIVAVLTAAAYKNEKVTNGIKEMLKDNTHFLSSFQSFMPIFAKNTKLRNALVKEN